MKMKVKSNPIVHFDATFAAAKWVELKKAREAM